MPTKSAVLAELTAIIAKGADYRPRTPPDRITLETRFKEDLGFDSIVLMSLVYELQELYPDLDEMQIGSWRTVDDLVIDVESVVK